MSKEFLVILIFTQIHINFGDKECILVENDPNQQKCDGGDIIERNICIPKSYEKIYPPVEPVMIGANIKELDIINIDIKNQVIRLGIDYAISWQDSRIKFIGNKTTEKMLEKDQTSKFWMPKLQVNKLMEVDSYGIIGRTTTLYVFPGCIERNTSPGTLITYASKDVISFACTMDFKDFPFDEQKCKLKVALCHKIILYLSYPLMFIF